MFAAALVALIALHSVAAIWVTAMVGSLADIGYLLFVDLPGYVNFFPDTVMKLISASAIILGFWSGVLIRSNPPDPPDIPTNETKGKTITDLLTILLTENGPLFVESRIDPRNRSDRGLGLPVAIAKIMGCQRRGSCHTPSV